MIKIIRISKRLLNCLVVFLACMNLNVNSEDVLSPITPGDAPDPNDESYKICELPYLGSDQPKPVPDNLMRMGPNSKYFILAGEASVPIKEVAVFCQSIGLQPAEIRHFYELFSVQVFLAGNALQDTVFSIGVNDEQEEGNFKEFDGTPMQFHVFAGGQPNNRMSSENCLEVGFHPKYPPNLPTVFGFLVYDDVDCSKATTPVCMFKPTDRCYLGSPSTFTRIDEEFKLVGSTNARDYYVKLKQYPWSEASRVCAESGFKLVDFNTGLNNNQELYGHIKMWLERNFIFPEVPFWTGAKLTPAYTANPDESSGPQYKFESSGKVLKDLSEWPSLAWGSGEPSNSSGIGMETCISAILYEKYQPSGNNIFTLATFSCKIPNYPICYLEKIIEPLVPSNETIGGQEQEKTDEGSGEVSKPSKDLNAGKFCTLDEIKVDVSKPALSVEELLKLAAVSRHKDISSNQFRFKWAKDDKWLTEMVEEIYRVPKQVCPSIYVPIEFINIMHNLLILYYNGVADQLKDPDQLTQQVLDVHASTFNNCYGQVKPIHLESVGGLPTTFEKISVTPISELVDFEMEDKEYLVPDMVVDTFWYLYLVTVGACYPYQSGTKILKLQELHDLFTTYYLEVFQKRWFSTKPRVDYGVIVGDLDVEVAYYSLKACAIATFHQSNISDLYFPRAVVLKTEHNDEELNLKMQDLPELVISEE